MDVLQPLLRVLAVLVGLGVFALLVLVLRRFVLTRPIGSFDCSLRGVTGRPPYRWALGVARYEVDRLDWFRVFTMSPRPGRSLSRARLMIVDRREPVSDEAQVVLPGAVILRCAYGSTLLELGMSSLAADGLAAWLESAPPGQNVIA